MKADLERRDTLRTSYGIFCGVCADHQTGRSENAPSIRCFDGFVHRDGEAEVVSRDNKLSHAAVFRLTSFPSRVRMNISPRQIVVCFVNAKNHDANAAKSRKGTS